MTAYYTGWVILAVYLAGILPACYFGAKGVLASETFGSGTSPDPEDAITAVVMGLIIAVAWPLSLVVWGMYRLISRGLEKQ